MKTFYQISDTGGEPWVGVSEEFVRREFGENADRHIGNMKRGFEVVTTHGVHYRHRQTIAPYLAGETLLADCQRKLAVVQQSRARLVLGLHEAQRQLRQLKSMRLKKFKYDDGEFQLWMQGEIIPMWADMFASWFKARGATNFVEIRAASAELGVFALTMQRVHGKTPYELMKEAQAERDALRGIVNLAQELRAARANAEMSGTSEAHTILMGAEQELFEAVAALDAPAANAEVKE